MFFFTTALHVDVPCMSSCAFLHKAKHLFSTRYIKGRVSYDQVNAVVQSINTAVKAKYKILHQPVKRLNSQSWKLKQRFKDQETKDTKGKDNLAVALQATDAHCG